MHSKRRFGRWSPVLAVLLVVSIAGCVGAEPTSPPFSPAPTLDSARAAVALTKFAELIKSPTLSMHLEQTSTMVAGAASQSRSLVFNYRMDISGRDFGATIFLAGQNMELRSIAGISYAKIGSGAWSTGPLDSAILNDILDPWRHLGPHDQLRLLSRTVNPREAFVFSNAGPIDYQTSEMRSQGIVGQITSLRFTVRPDGVPIDVTLNGDATALGAKVTFASMLTASRVGETITITKPVP